MSRDQSAVRLESAGIAIIFSAFAFAFGIVPEVVAVVGLAAILAGFERRLRVGDGFDNSEASDE